MSTFRIEDIPAALAKHLPHGARLEWPTQGMTSDVAFAVGATRTVVVKRCAYPNYLDWLRREHKVLRAIQGLGLRVPEVIDYTEQNGQAGPEVWLVMSRLQGRSLWRAMLETREGERGPLLARFGAVLRDLHSVRVPEALRQPTNWLTRTLAQARANLEWCDGDEALLRSLERSCPDAIPEVLIHGDLALGNVLIDEAGSLSLIDWSGGGSGDARYDIALALQTEPEITLTEEEKAAFHTAYGSAPLDAQTRRWFEQLYEFF